MPMPSGWASIEGVIDVSPGQPRPIAANGSAVSRSQGTWGRAQSPSSGSPSPGPTSKMVGSPSPSPGSPSPGSPSPGSSSPSPLPVSSVLAVSVPDPYG